MAAPHRASLAALGPLEQLRAKRLPLRLAWLLMGLFLYGASMAMVLRGMLGQFPWDVLHVGLGHHLPLSFGVIVVLVSFVVLLAWIPLRQPRVWARWATRCSSAPRPTSCSPPSRLPTRWRPASP